MKRERRIFENENIFIYIGTAIFFVLAISVGIIIYMTNKTSNVPVEEISKVEEQETKNIQPEEQNETKSASTEIGKTVEEQTEQTETTVKPEVKEGNKEAKQNTNTEQKQQETKPEVQQEEPKITETKKEITFTKPVEGDVICEYAKENLIYSETLKEWITHTGIDIKADKTSVVKAAADGIIKTIVNDPRYGLTIVIEHDDGYQTVYSNLLTAEFVVEGEEVTQGQTIGTVGNTAAFESEMESHIHFELMKNGEYLDPNIYLK